MNYIYIYDDKNIKKKMEVITTFQLENHSYNYIIYCELDRSHYYMAKYKESIEELNTDLTEKEMELCQNIFNEVMKNATRS